MSIESILSEIDAEIARLTHARKLLASSGSKTLTTKTVKAKAAPAKTKKRVLSTEARKRIAEAQKRRWAAQKARSKKES
jgi:dihydrodipicolinate reductase